MGRTKTLLDGLHLTDTELQQELYLRNDYDYQYESYRSSKEYADIVNDEIQSLVKSYSNFDIHNALEYASKSINVEPEELGKEVYNKLFSEKVIEYLKINND
jgi:hypothetical protein|tara:strand:+ start:297 stop:602 length:306 start_codon:yes stop_codon:yes gene_type:complete